MHMDISLPGLFPSLTALSPRIHKRLASIIYARPRSGLLEHRSLFFISVYAAESVSKNGC